MMPDSFATRLLRAQDQFEAWLEWYRSVCDIRPAHPTQGGFQAEVRQWSLGGFAVNRTIAPPLQVVRNKRHLRREPVDHWIVSQYTRGAHAANTAGTTLEVPAGVPFLWSLGQEFVHERTHVDRIQFIMSRDAFCDLAPLLDAACGSPLDTPLGRLLGDYMMALEHHLPAVTELDFPRLANAVGAMVAAAIAPSAERVAVARRQIDLGRKERVRQAIRRHLGTPTLGPRTLGRLVGMSRSNLYRLFEASGGVARYIQNQRLSAAYALLTDAENNKSITTLAEEFCFADASSFSRAFKREFGCSPGEARSAAQAGIAPVAVAEGCVSADRADFGGFLRRL
jgi:AraC-like DNA-binding protein